MTKFMTGLVTTVVAVVATAFTTGLPATGAAWGVLGITALGMVLTYIAKNAVFPSVSIYGNIDLRDVLSGLIMALGTAVSNWVGTIIVGMAIDWKSFLTMVIAAAVTYLATKFASVGQNT